MTTTYTARLINDAQAEIARAAFVRILDCVQWAERHGPPAARVDIYSATGRRTAQYRRPRPGTYPETIGVWVNAMID